MMKVIYLTDEQRSEIERLARARCGAKAPHVRVQDSGWNPGAGDRAYPHMVGLAAELAYAIATGAEIDTGLYRGGDDTDFGGIEIKATSHARPPFVLAIKQHEYDTKRPLAYVLARVDAEILRVEFLGSISRERFDRIKAEQIGKQCRNWAVGAGRLAEGLAVVRDGRLQLAKFSAAEVAA